MTKNEEVMVGEDKEEGEAILTGNYELDRRIGGFPIPTLLMIEGGNNSGKSVIVQQITYGALKGGHRVLYITTENTAISLIHQMESLSYNVKRYFIAGRLCIYTLHAGGISWCESISKVYLKILSSILKFKEGFSIFVIDSLSYIAVHASEEAILEFFTDARNIVDKHKKSILFTLHQHALSDDLIVRIRSICDAVISLYVKEVRDRVLRFLCINKLRGATKATNTIISFEVDPAFGIKVVPFSYAKA